MKSALDQNNLSTLSTVLLSNLEEAVFFGQISKFMLGTFANSRVQVFESFQDESTILRAEDGKAINNAKLIEKGKGLSGYVTRTKRSYYSNSKRDPIISTSIEDKEIEAALCAPIMSDGIVLGTILILTKDQSRKFSEDDVTLINEILSAADSALKNMKLYLTAKNLNKVLEGQVKQKEKELGQRGGILPATVKKEEIDLLGHSKAVVEIINIAKKVAVEDFPVMIYGSLGTGKKLLAKKIHSMSPRSTAPCVVVHCAAIDESALELELFGTKEQQGLLSRVTGGTLILDSIDELSIAMQSKILRVIMSGEIYPIDSKVAKRINVRFVSTTKKNLETMVQEGQFKEELFYRLNIVSLNMPSLKERTEDIKILAEHFLNSGKSKEDTKMLTTSALDKLMSYNWPGNVQELKNLMERTYIITSERYIDADHLPNLIIEIEQVVEKEESFSELTLHDLEKLHICKTLDHLGGNKTRAAKSLGITVKTLYNKLHSYGLVRGKNDE